MPARWRAGRRPAEGIEFSDGRDKGSKVGVERRPEVQGYGSVSYLRTRLTVWNYSSRGWRGEDWVETRCLKISLKYQLGTWYVMIVPSYLSVVSWK